MSAAAVPAERAPREGATRGRRRLAVLLLVLVGAAHLLCFALPNLGHAQPGAQLGAALFSVVASLTLILLCLRAASARQGAARWVARVLLVLLALLVGLQVYADYIFAAYLDESALQSAGDLIDSIRSVARTQTSGVVVVLGPLVLAAVVLPLLLAAVAPARPRRGPLLVGGAVALLLLVFAVFRFVPLNPGVSPDLLLALSLPRAANHPRPRRGSSQNRPHRRAPLPVPSLVAHPPRKRSLLVVLNESVRADETCIAFDPECTLTPAVNRTLPDRIPLLRLHALDSTTAISLGALLTGLPVDASKRELHKTPLVFEYAQAAGWSTAYLTSQNLEFGGAGEWLASVHFTETASSTAFDPKAPLEQGADDRLLLPYAAEKLAHLPEPFFALVQLSNTHFGYRIDPNDAPFQPTSEVLSEATAAPLRNRYRDAVRAQDTVLAAFLATFRASPAGKDTVILYLSDHGESFFERGYGYHATSLDEDEVHIPGWVDAPPDTLTPEETLALRARRDQPVTIADVAPTALDVMGLGNDPALERFRQQMPGQSWLAPPVAPASPLFMSNCTSIWTCAFMNFGALQGGRKFFVRLGRPYCFDTTVDPGEQSDLGVQECTDLASFALTRQARLDSGDVEPAPVQP